MIFVKSLYTFLVIAFLFSIAILGVNCSSEPPEIIVDPEFQTYVDRFIIEAEERGQTIDFSDTGLKLEFGTVPSESAGVCSEIGGAMHGSHEIRIDREYWNELNDPQKERLVFHELGHCELERPHDNQIFSSGDWKSIMRGNPLPAGRTALVNYSGSRKKYYLDELFNSSTPLPSWLSITSSYFDVLPEEKELLHSEDNVETWSIRPTITEGDNFEIEVTMQQSEGQGFVGFMWSGNDVNSSFQYIFVDTDELWISSGLSLYGAMQIIDFETQKSYDKNTLTVRKQGAYYYFFLNGAFIYWLDYEPLQSNLIQSLIKNDTVVEVQKVRVYKIS